MLQRSRAFLLLRYTLIIATAYLLLVEHEFSSPPVGLILLIVAALTSNVLLPRLPAHIINSTAFNASVIIGDTLWITVALLYSGLFGVEFFYLYFFVLLLAAIGENLKLIVIGTFAVCAAYAYTLSASGGTWSFWNSPSLIRLPFLFTTAVFYGYLVHRVRDEQQRARQEADTVSRLEETQRKMAEHARELEEFAYVASHDLQEPLRMVGGYTQLLAKRYKGKLDADADEFITYAVDGVTRMQQLINDLLAYSRVGTRGKEFQLTNCQTVLDQAVLNLQVAMEETGAVVAHDPLPTVMGDATQLGQVFQNLIGNAIKFRGAQPPEVHVGADRRNGEWLFWVQDNGIGIAREDAERIFTIFQRLHEKEKYPGTGLGLAICKKIVGRHSGRIWVESEPAKGATFYFTIPDRGVKSCD